MADAKISALTALTGANLDATADVLAVVDTSATTSKKMTADELLIGLLASTTNARFKVGTLTRDMTASTGDVPYTGVGFKPKSIIFMATVANTSRLSVGADDGTTTAVIYDQNPQSANTYNFASSASISMLEGIAITFQTAKVKTFDTDGFTLTWTKNGSPTAGNASVIYLAFR